MLFRLLEGLVVVGGLSALLAARQLMRRRDQILTQLQRLATQLAAGDEAMALPQVSGTMGGLAAALDALGKQLAELRESGQGRLERARRLAEAVLEAMPDPVLVFDGEARVQRFNSAASALFGPKLQAATPAAALGDGVLRLAAEEASLGFPVASNQVPHVDLLRAGVRRVFRVRALPLPGGQLVGAVLVLQDVTESDAEAAQLREAAQSALYELRPLVDALGTALLCTSSGEPAQGVAQWQAIQRVLADVESVGAAAPRAPVDLAALVDETLEAVALEAQRARVRLSRRIERPAPAPVTDRIAAERLLLRTLRLALQRCPADSSLEVEVLARPRPAVRVQPGSLADTPLDAALLERAQVAPRAERHGATEAVILQFAQGGVLA